MTPATGFAQLDPLTYHPHVNVNSLYYNYLPSLLLQDYKGQKLAEQIFQGIILISAVSKHDAFKLAIQMSHYSKSVFTCSVSVISFVWFFPGDWIRVWSDH